MREARWGDVFVERNDPLILAEVPQEPKGWRRLLWWEEWVTFLLVGSLVMTVVVSVQQANWVDTMPSLYPLAFFGLVVGAFLARARWPEPIVHAVALPIGAVGAFITILSITQGGSLLDRYWDMHHRMAQWVHVAAYGGISNDDLPFIVLVVPLVWLSAYLSAWAVFRWHNAWAAVIPGGAVLLANMSFLPGAFSLAFVVFLVMAGLLVTRINLLERAKQWRAESTPYPPMLSLSVLHATFWLVIVLLGAAWLLPSAGETSKLESTWQGVTDPVVSRVEGISRLFVGVNNKKSVRVHDFEDILPLLGSIELPQTKIADVKLAQSIDQPLFLKGGSYNVYTSGGWLRGEGGDIEDLPRGESASGLEAFLDARRALSATIQLRRSANQGLLTPGQAQTFDIPVRVQGSNSYQDDVQRVLPESRIRSGDSYTATGTVSVATEDELRAASPNYPFWVKAAYLGLPDDLPDRVGGLAGDVTASEENAYDRAVAIEQHLRENYPFSLNVPNTPQGRDAVDYFLFDAMRGYFDYHASAMVVMLRTLGVPSRVAVGYIVQGADYDAASGQYRVTEASAFAWPEVYFPGYGWLEFNPTPDYAPVRRASEQPLPEAPVISLPPNFGMGFGELPAPEPRADSPLPLPSAPDGGLNRAAWIAIAAALGLITLLIAGGAGAHYAWTRGLSHLDPPARLWGQTVRLASWAGVGPAPDATPREFAVALSARVPQTQGATVLAEGFVRHRYGREHTSPQSETHLNEAWRGIRGVLLRRLVRRK